jgi:hypothetical protein
VLSKAESSAELLIKSTSVITEFISKASSVIIGMSFKNISASKTILPSIVLFFIFESSSLFFKPISNIESVCVSGPNTIEDAFFWS